MIDPILSLPNIWKDEALFLQPTGACFDLKVPGPLQSPVKSCSVGRDMDGSLVFSCVLEEHAARDIARFPHQETGQIWINTHTAELRHRATGEEAIATGVLSRGFSGETNSSGRMDRTETGTFDSLGSIASAGTQCQILEFVDNFPSEYVLPDLMEDISSATFVRKFPDSPTPISEIGQASFSMGRCLKLSVSGVEIIVGANKNWANRNAKRPGFILYKKSVQEEQRRIIRECLSFTFGRPLVYWGYSALDADLKIVGWYSKSPFSMDQQAYELFSSPPAPITTSKILIEQSQVQRMMVALLNNYESLELRRIFWAYWHALCAPMHTRAACFGSAIETLQSVAEGLPSIKVSYAIVDKPLGAQLRKKIGDFLDELKVSGDQRTRFGVRSQIYSPPPPVATLCRHRKVRRAREAAQNR